MNVADLYIRYGRDSLNTNLPAHAEQRLRAYCKKNNITIRQVVIDVGQSSCFKSRAWKDYLRFLKKGHPHNCGLLFTTWDRFSRNAADAYWMINTLRELGVEPQAAEQPLGASIAENKMMMALYLAAPQVGQDRRALSVTDCMHKARREGRYMGPAPMGYANKKDGPGRKYIAPAEPMAGMVRWLFAEIAKEVYNPEKLFQIAKQKGFLMTRKQFNAIIGNPVYCSRIFLPKYGNQESTFIKGQHEPLISESLFYHVQDILDRFNMDKNTTDKVA